MSTKTLAEAMTDEINRRKITKVKAAEIMGVDSIYVSRWSTGAIKEPEPKFYKPIRDFLHVDQNTLGGLIIEAKLRDWQAKEGSR